MQLTFILVDRLCHQQKYFKDKTFPAVQINGYNISEEVGQANVRCLNVQYFPYILIHSNIEYLVLNSGTTVFIVPISIKICRVTRGYLRMIGNSRSLEAILLEYTHVLYKEC